MVKEKGFTIIELLVIIAIVGILAAIAVPQFAEYKKRGFDVQAKNDLRKIATAQEAYFVDNDKYVSCTESTCGDLLAGIGQIDEGVKVSVIASIDGSSFTAAATHESGTGATCYWDSTQGGLMSCEQAY